MAEFVVLGPLAVVVGGQERPVSGTRQRRLLSVLVMQAGRAVSVPALVEAVWGVEPPTLAAATLQSYVSRLRGVLGAGLVSWTSSGYRLDAEPSAVDAYRFEDLLARAGSAASPAEALPRLNEALALWRGDPYPDLAHNDRGVAEAARLVELRMMCLEERARVLLALDNSGDAVAELLALTLAQPLRERPWQMLMHALHRSGRQADALRAFRRYDEILAAEGLEPSASTKTLRSAILAAPESVRDDGGPQRLGTGAGANGPDRRPAVPPAHLPADLSSFAGRGEQLRQLDALVRGGDTGNDAATVVITAIAGAAGVGKTALAVHWAHRMADRFPDGQLYVNLRGFTPGGSVMSPAEAVRMFLDAFEVAPERIPTDLMAQVGLYRSLLAGKRVLVVLDNARDAEQVRPLLPGAAGCLAVVTSRSRLSGLVAAEGVRLLTLDVLSVAEAREMVARRIGGGRVRAEPVAADEIIARCARLPLALAVMAARAAAQPGFPLASLVDELRADQGGLDAFAADDPSTDIRAVFSSSYQMLSGAAARLFRLLGIHPGPDIGRHASASLAGMTVRQVRPILAELAHAHLITEHVPRRFVFHDLLRAYAAELAEAQDGEGERCAVTRRAVDHYLQTGYAAAMLLYPARQHIKLEPPAVGVTREELVDYDEALAWFTAEHRVLIAAIQWCDTASLPAHAWQLAWTLSNYLDWRGHWHDWITTQRAGLVAARQLDDRAGQAGIHGGLGNAYAQVGRYDEARTHIQHALDLYAESGYHDGEAAAHLAMANLLDRLGDHRPALGHTQRAYELFRDTGNRSGQANALNTLGWCHAQLDQPALAIDPCQQALSLFAELDDRFGTLSTLDSLGYAQHRLGRHREAIALYQRNLRLQRQVGDRYREAGTLIRLGDSHHAAGELDVAREAWREGLTILDELGHPDAEQIRARVADGTGTATGS